MKLAAQYLALTLRVAFAWWALLTIVSAFFSFSVAFLGAIIVFPVIALGVGAIAAWVQYRALSVTSSNTAGVAPLNPLSFGQRLTCNVALPAEQALRVAIASLTSAFGQINSRVTDSTVVAEVIEKGVAPLGLARFRCDEISITVLRDTDARCSLRISCEPKHIWLYALFWVEAGRGARQAERLQQTILQHLRTQSSIADKAAQHNALHARLGEMELLLLRAHIEPHFLFNTLAHVRASLHDDLGCADAMLEALINFMRANSAHATKAQLPLIEEMERVKSYLEIMKIRLDQSLNFDIDCAATLHSIGVPNACVLVLVENAIKHGIERCHTGGKIAITCKMVGDSLNIEVENDGPALGEQLGEGARPNAGGLGNLLERLRLVYGDRAQLHIENRQDDEPEQSHAHAQLGTPSSVTAGGVRACLQLPVHSPMHSTF